MPEEERSEPTQTKFRLKKDNITALTELPQDMSSRWKSLGWPMEIQGTARPLEGTADYKFAYPVGDVFVSFGVVVHELGHLRQEEDERFVDADKNSKDYVIVLEEDAYERGWQRAERYCPEVVAQIEEKFQEYRRQGKMQGFASFKDFYTWLRRTVDINRALGSVPASEDEQSREELEFQALKNGGVEEFFGKLNALKVGEPISREFIEDFIIKVAEKIVEE